MSAAAVIMPLLAEVPWPGRACAGFFLVWGPAAACLPPAGPDGSVPEWLAVKRLAAAMAREGRLITLNNAWVDGAPGAPGAAEVLRSRLAWPLTALARVLRIRREEAE